ncbi:glutamate--tRNA ligase [Candidatus Riesia pediculischaeffi]|uniref:Glutamate--tRNA ligase n=1 Tax=Candidatus Riesia pediculischaeffi TaxID=428411 RepID=A0A1V0HK29_9ENTR|nr:glutamate--tRNA ligase [Candidatus Riesia pediculischaeffi]ARC53179.1 glutamine--tRNA ligase [Candidatus Riesia pediculischaeffi]
MKNIKTRFAPSPTGNLHLGNVRTALYSWLFSRKFNGKFVLRIEDTDLSRSSEESKKDILDIMKWLKLNWDEGPYYQSQRIEYYNNVIEDMISKNLAYRCYCSRERLNALRKKQIGTGEKPKYDGNCRNVISYVLKNRPHVVRFRNPDLSVVVKDLIRGKIIFHNSELDDFIIRRENGIPTYNFCASIDDHEMGITHIIRGEEHISNTPKQINFLRSIGANIPDYIHISSILNHDGKKISKREDKIYGVKFYKKQGFLPEAILNYLLRLGWSYGDIEIFNIQDMKKYFSIESIGRSPSMLNYKKMLWINRCYIRSLSNSKIMRYLEDFYIAQEKLLHRKNILEKVVRLFKDRCNTLYEMIELSEFLFHKKIKFQKIEPIYFSKTFLNILDTFKKEISKISNWKISNIHSTILDLSKKFKIDIKKIYMLLRIVLTGKNQSPEISFVIHEIGKG